MSNFWKCAQGAAAARAEICNLWHFYPIPISLKLNSHQFAFFNDQKRTTTSRVDNRDSTNQLSVLVKKKSRIRETKHLSTDADSSTNAIGGWTKAKSATKKNFFCAAILDHFQTKMFKCYTTSFHYFSPRILNL